MDRLFCCGVVSGLAEAEIAIPLNRYEIRWFHDRREGGEGGYIERWIKNSGGRNWRTRNGGEPAMGVARNVVKLLEIGMQTNLLSQSQKGKTIVYLKAGPHA